MAENRHHSPVIKEPRITLYAYAEMLESGTGNKPVKVVTRIGKVSRRYETRVEGSYQRVYLGALEQAAEIACNEVYRLKEQKERFSRVFISRFEDAQRARVDSDSFDYGAKHG